MQNPEQSESTGNRDAGDGQLHSKNESAMSPGSMPDTAHESSEGEDFVPRGAMRFALVLIVGYIIYYFLIWHEVVILRGGA